MFSNILIFHYKENLRKSKFVSPSYFKSNTCCDYKLKMVQKGVKKGGFNFPSNGTPDWEKESSINKSKEKSSA